MPRFTFIYLGSFFLLISVLSFFNIIYSYYFNLYLNIDTYAVTLIISLLLGLVFLFKKKDLNKITIFQKILTVILGYFILPLIISLPYTLSIYNVSIIDCYFESISGFTSTGFTIFENIKHLDPSLILWRSTSQWIGGLYFLFSIILLIDIFDESLKKSLTELLSFNTSETFKQSFKVLILYAILTLIIFIILKFINLRTFDSFNFALTLIASGGFLPTNNLEAVLNSDIKIIVFSLLTLVSFFSIFLSYNLFFLKQKNLNVFTEDFYLLIYLLFLIVIFFIFFNFNNDFSNIFFGLSSSVSNIGIYFDESYNKLDIIYLILVIIGGSFFSTSSGLRFFKLFTLTKFSINELLSHTRPKQIFANKISFSEKNINQSDIKKYFLTISLFILSLFVVTILLTLNNIDFVYSFKLGILTIMNTVNSGLYGLENFDFQNINFISKIIFILFMIIGRVELISILILLKKFLFKS
tara:strand:- start:75 stop:1481 length:1407 start_codon:yes stop_codon:yes gene_type:complete